MTQVIKQQRIAKIREGNSRNDPIVTLGKITQVLDPRISDTPVIKCDGEIFKSFLGAAKHLALKAGYNKLQIKTWGVWTDKTKSSW